MILGLGSTSPAPDRAYGLFYNNAYLRSTAAHEHSPSRWPFLANSQPAAIDFWYRESPRNLISLETVGEIYPNTPPMTVSGMVEIELDTRGRMVYLHAVPPQVEESAASPTPIESGPLFAAAGIDATRFQPTEPKWTPPGMADTRAAWTGTFQDRPENPIRIEAAAWRGKPVYFQIVGPWTVPARMQPAIPSLKERAGSILFLAVFLITVIAAAIMARQNLQRGRGDKRGALRLGI